MKVELDLPQWEWPRDERRLKLFAEWQTDFLNEHGRDPNIPEMLEWAYQLGKSER